MFRDYLNEILAVNGTLVSVLVFFVKRLYSQHCKLRDMTIIASDSHSLCARLAQQVRIPVIMSRSESLKVDGDIAVFYLRKGFAKVPRWVDYIVPRHDDCPKLRDKALKEKVLSVDDLCLLIKSKQRTSTP